MTQRNIEYRTLDNAFGWIADFEQAQKLANDFGIQMLHRKLGEFAGSYGPVVKQFELNYHWSLDRSSSPPTSFSGAGAICKLSTSG